MTIDISTTEIVKSLVALDQAINPETYRSSFNKKKADFKPVLLKEAEKLGIDLREIHSDSAFEEADKAGVRKEFMEAQYEAQTS